MNELNITGSVIEFQKPEALTTFGRSDFQKYNLHNNRYLQPVEDGQLNPA
jgi:hypothetical protein